MELKLCEKYKHRVIYKDMNTGFYVVYEDEGDEVAREAIRLFVQNDIDINIPLFAHNTSNMIIKNDIDVEAIINRSEGKFGMHCWV